MTSDDQTAGDDGHVTDDACAPLRALGVALAAAAAAAAELAARQDDADALAGVVALDDALEELPALQYAITALLAVAQAGGAVESHLADRSAVASSLDGELTALRAAAEEAQAREDGLRAQIVERDALREKLITLRRVERLAGALGELEGQRQLIDDRLAALVAPVATAEAAVGRGATDLLRLTEQRRELLEPQVATALERAAAAQRELAAVEEAIEAQRDALAEATRKHEELVALHRDRVAALRTYAAVDRDLATAFADLPGSRDSDRGDSGLGRATAIVDEAQARLVEVDTILGRIVEDRRSAVPRPVVT